MEILLILIIWLRYIDATISYSPRLVVRDLYFLLGGNQAPLKFCLRLKYFSIWNCDKRASLPVLQGRSPTISVIEILYEMQFSVCFIRKLTRAQQHKTVTLASAGPSCSSPSSLQ